MSRDLERLVRDNSKLRRSAKAVLLAIAAYAEDGKGAYLSVATLAKGIGGCERAVRYGLKAAVEAGELKRIFNHGPNGTNRYEIRIDRLKENATCTLQNLHAKDLLSEESILTLLPLGLSLFRPPNRKRVPNRRVGVAGQSGATPTGNAPFVSKSAAPAAPATSPTRN
jgi:hypothetical protein